MACEVCGNKDGPCGDRKSKKSSFYIHLRTNFEDHMNVPCFARDKFHAKTKNKSVLCVQNNDKEYYEFLVKKKTYKTCIYGDEYNRFLMDYNINHGDKIKIHLNKKCICGFFFLEAFDKHGYPKQRVEEEFDFLESAKAVAVTKGLNLTYTQISKINQIVDGVGLGLGVVYVHKINGSDIAKNMLHIPKFATSNLDIPKNGIAVLEVTENGKHDYEEAEYYTSSDGRIRFDNGWKTFAQRIRLGPGDIVVMLFDMIEDYVHINITEVA